MIPLPLPEMMSSKVFLCLTWDSAKDRMSSFWEVGSTRLLNAEALKTISDTESTKKDNQRLDFRAAAEVSNCFGENVKRYKICQANLP